MDIKHNKNVLDTCRFCRKLELKNQMTIGDGGIFILFLGSLWALELKIEVGQNANGLYKLYLYKVLVSLFKAKTKQRI